ncbi:MAG: glycosyltransferase [Cyanobium sp.]
MTRLSLAMIVRDEEDGLQACLESVIGFVDEMVVVDTGSRDGTVAIAERCGARVHHLSWPGDFAPARNHSLELAEGEWVLVLDADEQLLPEARAPLQALMADPDALLITLLRLEEGAAQSPYSSVSRLFRRHPAIRWSGAHHAMVDDSVAALISREPHWRVLQCPTPALRHGGYRAEKLADGRKARRLREAMQAELRQRPADPYACAKLAGLELSEGRSRRALALLRRGLAACPPTATAERYELLLHLGLALADSDPPQARRHYRDALALPLDPRLQLGALLNLAALELRHGSAAEALQLARQVTTTAPDLALGWYNLGLIQRQRGALAEAIAAYQRAIALAPDHAATHQNLAAASLLAGDIAAARQGFRRAIALLRAQGQTSEADNLAARAGTMVRLDTP